MSVQIISQNSNNASFTPVRDEPLTSYLTPEKFTSSEKDAPHPLLHGQLRRRECHTSKLHDDHLQCQQQTYIFPSIRQKCTYLRHL